MKEAEIQVTQAPPNVKIEAARKCGECGATVGKGKSYCDECQRQKRLRRQRANAHKKWVNPEVGKMQCPASVLNFRRDEDGKPIEKRCTKCDTWKPIADFPARKDTPSGTHAWCGPCHRETRKKYSPTAKDFSVLFHGTCRVCMVTFVGKRKKSFCSDQCKQTDAREKQRIKTGSIHAITHAICKNCGESKPLNEFNPPTPGLKLKMRPTSCIQCGKCNKSKLRAIYNKSPKNKPRMRLSKRFHETMASVKRGGNHCFRDIVGCSSEFLRKHLESQFTKGIKWSNYGTKWHVDHIVPVASFDHNDPEQVKRCWHYSNLRPLCAIENNMKSDKIVTCQPELLLQLS